MSTGSLIVVLIVLFDTLRAADPKNYQNLLQSQFLDVHDAIAAERYVTNGKYSENNTKVTQVKNKIMWTCVPH